jgi:hypothetical protein
MAQAVSQFVGTARGGWGDAQWTMTVGTKDALAAAGKTTVDGAAWAIPRVTASNGERVGMSVYIATESPGILEPSNLSRALIHETLHYNDSQGVWGVIWNKWLWGHNALDSRARQLNMQYGFGKCDAMGGFPGC